MNLIFFDKNWLEEDYLIQDDELLVQFAIYESKEDGYELITVDSSKVRSKIQQFDITLTKAQRFSPNHNND